jgi:hypothetical protein
MRPHSTTPALTLLVGEGDRELFLSSIFYLELFLLELKADETTTNFP